MRALRAPAVGYAWLLLGAVVTMVLIVVAANVGSTGDETGVDSDDTNAIGVLVGMPFQIAGMALLGSLHFTEEGVSASLFLPPLLLTVLFFVTTARAARRDEAIPEAGTRAVLAAIVGLVAALVVTVLTRVLAMRADGAAVHATSVALFFGVWVLTAVASYVGTSRAVGATRPAWVRADHVAAVRVWAGSVALWVVVSTAVVVVVAAVQVEPWVGLLLPVWAVTVGLYTYTLGHLGNLSFGGEGVNLGDVDTGWAILLVLGALVLAVLSSLAWHLRRDTDGSTLAEPRSWAILPATYAAGGLVVWLLPSVVLGGGFGTFGASVTLQPAFWVVFVLLLWGAAIEAASRYLAPSLVTVLPPRVRALLRGPEPASTASGPVVAAGEPRPLTPQERARLRMLGIGGGALVVVVVAAWIAIAVVNSRHYGPEKQVEAYLDAVVDGDLDEAAGLATLPDDERADESLMTSEIYRSAESRITGYEIGDVEEDGDVVTVEVRLEGLGGEQRAELVVEKDGRTDVLFDRWRVVDGGLARSVTLWTPESTGDLAVNDVAVGALDETVWLLPGSYVFDAFAGNRWLESSGEPVPVVADEDYQYVEVPGAVVTDAFREEVQRQVDEYLEECLASTELDPDGCPNSAYGGSDVRAVEWTLDRAPTPDFDSFDGTFPADLGYGETGQATVTYEADQSYGFGPRDWQPQTEQSDLYLSSVTVTEEGDDLVVSIDE